MRGNSGKLVRASHQSTAPTGGVINRLRCLLGGHLLARDSSASNRIHGPAGYRCVRCGWTTTSHNPHWDHAVVRWEDSWKN